MMATIALSRPIAPHRNSSSIGSLTSTITLDTSQCPAPVPNKHIPVCPPGPVPQQEPTTPPPSPGKEADALHQSLLFPPTDYVRLDLGRSCLYKIDVAGVAAALDYLARQPLPDPSQVFPWLHGLHPNNQIQLAFFIARKRSLRKTPGCLRGITIVKADGDLDVSRLKGAIAPHEFLQLGNATAEFLEADPREGFSVRNFQIQAAKAAMTSDIIVYGDDELSVRKLGFDIAGAQQRWREKQEAHRNPIPHYNTFVCVSPFGEFEELYPEIVAVNSSGQLTGQVLDFFHQERREMYEMTRASEISHNVWLGPTPDQGSDEELCYDVLIECNDLGRLNPGALQAIAEGTNEPDQHLSEATQTFLEFPSSGSILAPTWSHAEADGILDTCKWIWHLAHGTLPSAFSASSKFDHEDSDGDIDMLTSAPSTPNKPRRILIHCADGYTESTMLGLAYYSFATFLPIPEAWLALHTTQQRNFFAYPSDVALLTAIAPRLLQESPLFTLQNRTLSDITSLIRNEPKWFAGFDGSFPSRILDYMYLGNLGHANNPDLLKSLGIGQILSVGELAMWRDGELEQWGEENTCVVQGVQDNGIDPLTDEFERCLEFIGKFPFGCFFPSPKIKLTNPATERGRRNGTATLVHCRVGVSRSATICIAEVMRSLRMSFPRAYCFVRARRLNVIIQPHLRFGYELLKWEEQNQGEGFKRELEWPEIAREIALMNRPYAR